MHVMRKIGVAKNTVTRYNTVHARENILSNPKERLGSAIANEGKYAKIRDFIFRNIAETNRWLCCSIFVDGEFVRIGYWWGNRYNG